MKQAIRDQWAYSSATVQEWAVHARYVWDWSTDGCSNVPDWNFKQCCQIHDFHYRNGNLSRRDADRMLRECITSRGWLFVPWIYWLGVRLLGWRPYREHRRKAFLAARGKKRG